MATYVISDIHGCFDEFQKMLKKVKFSWSLDRLIIAGDLTDRGPQNLEILKWMEEKRREVVFIMGNHDIDLYTDFLIYSKYMKDEEVGNDAGRLFKKYPSVYRIGTDKYDTVKDLILNKNVKAEDMDRWADIIAGFPYYIELNINDKDYIICHAGYLDSSYYSDPDFRAQMLGHISEQHFNLWAREEMLEYGGKKGVTCIFGHTPTISPRSIYYNHGKVFIYEDELRDCRFVNIDCGYVYHKVSKEANMAMIRLEDEKIFYLK